MSYMHTYMLTYIPHTLICIHADTHTCMHAYIHTHVHAYVHSCIHTYTHAHIHTYKVSLLESKGCRPIYYLLSMWLIATSDLAGKFEHFGPFSGLKSTI